MIRRIGYGAATIVAMIAGAVLDYTLFVLWDARPARAFRNVSPSMAPTLLAGDRFTIRVLSAATPVARGDIVAHVYPPDRSEQFVKRVVGLPGDTLAMVHGHLTINGRQIQEPYAWHEDTVDDRVSDDFRWQRPYVVGPAARDTAAYMASRDNWGPLAVPERMYFVLGDNRDNSLDSRYWGFLPAADVLGQARRIYFSQDSAGHLRLSRFGLRLH
jgi:signal peptidase I